MGSRRLQIIAAVAIAFASQIWSAVHAQDAEATLRKNQALAEKKSELRRQFLSANQVQAFSDQSTLKANPFVYKDKVVALRADFDQMLSQTEARFGEVLVSDVPNTQFTNSSSPMIL